MEEIKTQKELDELDQVEVQKLGGNADYKPSREYWDVVFFHRVFANDIANHLAGAKGFIEQNLNSFELEQVERGLGVHESVFYQYLLQMLRDAEFDSEEEMQEAWSRLNTYVCSLSEDKRDEMATQFRTVLPPIE